MENVKFVPENRIREILGDAGFSVREKVLPVLFDGMLHCGQAGKFLTAVQMKAKNSSPEENLKKKQGGV